MKWEGVLIYILNSHFTIIIEYLTGSGLIKRFCVNKKKKTKCSQSEQKSCREYKSCKWAREGEFEWRNLNKVSRQKWDTCCWILNERIQCAIFRIHKINNMKIFKCSMMIINFCRSERTSTDRFALVVLVEWEALYWTIDGLSGWISARFLHNVGV